MEEDFKQIPVDQKLDANKLKAEEPVNASILNSDNKKYLEPEVKLDDKDLLGNANLGLEPELDPELVEKLGGDFDAQEHERMHKLNIPHKHALKGDSNLVHIHDFVQEQKPEPKPKRVWNLQRPL